MNAINMSEHLSKLVWDWIKTTHKIPHAMATETGITSYLMYGLSHCDEFGKTDFFFFDDTKRPEKITGADFFLVIRGLSTTQQYLIQAKRMYRPKNISRIPNIIKNKYGAFKHKVTQHGLSMEQFSIFLNYCKTTHYKPLYCFYNSIYDQSFSLPQQIKQRIYTIDSKYTSNNQDVLGVTLAKADDIRTHLFPQGNIRNFSFEEMLSLNSAVSLQQFFRNLKGSDGAYPFPPTKPNPSDNGKTTDTGNIKPITKSEFAEGIYVEKEIQQIQNIVSTSKTPTIKDLSKSSINAYEKLDKKGKNIVNNILEHNIDYLPIMMLNLD